MHATLHTLHKLPRGALHIVLVGAPAGLTMPLTTRLEAQCLGGFFCLGATLVVVGNLQAKSTHNPSLGLGNGTL